MSGLGKQGQKALKVTAVNGLVFALPNAYETRVAPQTSVQVLDEKHIPKHSNWQKCN